jgi:pilus assembly protein CpaB
MGTTRMLILAVAAVAAMALAFVVKGMATGPAPAVAQAAPAPPPKPMAKVLVAARDLPIGTRLVPEDLSWMEWPVDALNVSFITDGAAAKAPAPTTGPDGKPIDPAMAEKVAAASEAVEAARKAIMDDPGGPIVALSGAIVKEPIFANEPITDRKLVRAGQGGYMAVVIQPGMRAMAIPVSVETAAGGFILPGDRVDVLLSRQLGQTGGGTAQFVSETVMRNVRVLAVDQTAAPAPGTNAVVGAVATIEVAPVDAEALNLAQAQGDLSLTLRSYADISDPSGRVARRAEIVARPASAAAYAPQTIRVWRGGQPTEMAMNSGAPTRERGVLDAAERAASSSAAAAPMAAAAAAE